jgi:hypothetical protein
MYTLSDQLQFQANAINEGRHQLASEVRSIIDWINKQFGVRALDFSCETKSVPNGNSRQLVHLIMRSVDDVKLLQSNREGSVLIAERFLTYFKSIGTQEKTTDQLKKDVLSFDRAPFPQIVVTYRPLQDVETKVLQEMLDAETSEILKSFESVWTISQRVIFFYTDAQKKENVANGISVKLTEALDKAAERYGLKHNAPYYFDSKETFDRDYESKWHYYWK